MFCFDCCTAANGSGNNDPHIGFAELVETFPTDARPPRSASQSPRHWIDDTDPIGGYIHRYRTHMIIDDKHRAYVQVESPRILEERNVEKEVRMVTIHVAKGQIITGLELDSEDSVVQRIRSNSYFAEWNADRHPFDHIGFGDKLMSLNDDDVQTLTPEQVAEVISNVEIERRFLFRRCIEWEIVLRRRQSNARLGLDVSNAGDGIKCRNLKEGVIQDFNIANPLLALLPGDRIRSVNGVTREPNLMLKTFGNIGDLHLICSRNVL